jgi:phosphatidylserine/phosphatidylglycerophosphate/cardiolipin synthase-like enzyme
VIGEIVSGLDARLGDVVEDTATRHHVRRLARLGWGRALRGDGDAWAMAPPARDGNSLQVHVDGTSALPAMAAAVRSARSYVHIAGWTVDPEFAVERHPAVVTVRELLSEAAHRVDVRVLVWAGAPLPIMQPSRATARKLMDGLVRGTRIRGALDPRNRPMHCHHEKLVIVDGTQAFVGGIDLTALAGDRYDGSPHRRSGTLGWHDAAAQLAGPAVADVCAHFAMRWQATTGETLPAAIAPPAAGDSRVQVIRTVPERTYKPLPRGDFSILEAYIGALRRARRLIYLENQFLWSPEVTAVLRAKLLQPPSDDFRLCIVLPRHPNNGNDDTRGQLGMLQAADHRHRLLVGTVGPVHRQHPPVYVHAKVAIVDDGWLTVGSANLNEHSLFNDTEVNVVTDDAVLARSVREQLWSEHLNQDCRGADPLEVIETAWRKSVTARPPYENPLRPLPSVSRRSARLLGPLKGLLVDG